MASIEEIREARLAKIIRLKELGINPYPVETEKTHTLKQARDQFEKLEKDKKEITVVGRIISLRGQGALLFIDLFDGTGKLQVLFKRDSNISYIDNDADGFELFKKTVDQSDFIEVSGTLFVTKRGEQTLLASSWKILSKSLRAVPDEWYGLKDDDERYRKRYLDLLLNDELRDMFIKKAQFWKTIRGFLEERDFIEVETPTLELTTGGAEARPFETHHNDFDLDVFLRISVGELWQKRLMTAGFPKTFEIGRAYRNEGSSSDHVQEFTNIEFYTAYTNLDQGKEMVRDLYRTIAKDVFGTTLFETRGHNFDLADDWKEIDYVEEIKRQTSIDILSASEKDMEEKLKELKVTFEGKNKERLTDSLWKYCRKNIGGPVFLVHHPKLVAPLSKVDPEHPEQTVMFQVILAGSEIGRAHAELNDPVDQASRFKIQKELIESGDKEAMMSDDEFIETMEYGMPPIFGFGFGERLFAFLANKPIREIQLFPLMKPKE